MAPEVRWTGRHYATYRPCVGCGVRVLTDLGAIPYCEECAEAAGGRA